jgi:four helix bundle protein
MKKEDLQQRTRLFCARIVHMVESMPETRTARTIAPYLLRSTVSIGVKYRGACRPASAREFINKLKEAECQTDETLFWLELIEETNIFPPEKIKDLKIEANELLAIFVSSINTARKNLKQKAKVNLKPKENDGK